MTKKKILKYVLIAVIAAAAVFAGIFIHYFATTMSVDQCREYCMQNSRRYATHFARLGDDNNYAYFIAADGDEEMAQEAFIFKKKNLGSIAAFDRYRFIASTHNEIESRKEGDTEYGVIHFFQTNDRGKKEPDSTLIFFGAKASSKIASYEYTLTVREGSSVFRGNVVGQGPDFWFVTFHGVNNSEETRKRVISDVKFYDAKGNLIAVY